MSDLEPSLSENPGGSQTGERFVQLFALHHHRLLVYIYSLVPRMQDAEDILQKTSPVLWRKLDQLEPEGNFLAWACRVAYLEVCNFRRTAARDRMRFSDELLAYLAEERVADLSETSRRLAALRECVQQLGRPQQELLHQVYASEESVQQLAARPRRAVQTLYNRLFRIRRLLLDCVQGKLKVEEASS